VSWRVLSNQILLFFVACGDCTKELPLTLSFYNAVFFSICEDLCVTTALNFTAIHKESRCGDCVRNLLEPVIFFYASMHFCSEEYSSEYELNKCWCTKKLSDLQSWKCQIIEIPRNRSKTVCVVSWPWFGVFFRNWHLTYCIGMTDNKNRR
jgi:hypothetical protein